MGHIRPLKERFWSKVETTETCWLWTGTRTKAGYGQINVKGVPLYAHRLSYAWERGAIPEGKMILHRCDNPPCVRPSHLFLGDGLANMRDMIAKGRDRHPRMVGTQIGTAKLTEAQVREIREKYHTVPMLAKEYGVSEGTITFVIKNQTWRHV